MRLSTKTRYGTRAITELASTWPDRPLSVATMAERQDLSVKYLERIMAVLKKGAIVRAVPGHGYLLARSPSEIRMDEVFRVLEGERRVVPCIDDTGECSKSSTCKALPVWIAIDDAVTRCLASMTLEDVALGRVRRSGRASKSKGKR